MVSMVTGLASLTSRTSMGILVVGGVVGLKDNLKMEGRAPQKQRLGFIIACLRNSVLSVCERSMTSQ